MDYEQDRRDLLTNKVFPIAKRGEIPLLRAVINKDLYLVRMLLESDVDVNRKTRNESEKNALYYAVENNDTPMIALLLGHRKINLSQTVVVPESYWCESLERRTKYILDWALECKNYPLVKYLLCQKNAPYAKDFVKKICPNFHEFGEGGTHVINELYRRGVSYQEMLEKSIVREGKKLKRLDEGQRNKSFSFLYTYFQKKNIPFLQECLDHCLYNAICQWNIVIASIVIKHGAAPNYCNNKDLVYPTLFFLPFFESDKMLKFLVSTEEIKQRIRIERHVDIYGNGPLHTLAQQVSTYFFFEWNKSVRALCFFGFNANQPNNMGQVPLHIIAKKAAKYDVYGPHGRLLIDLGADKDTCDDDGKRPINYIMPWYIPGSWCKKYVSWCKNEDSLAAVLYNYKALPSSG